MDTIKIADKKHTKMIAHRGMSGIERENTLPAFIAAGNRSYYGEECDIHLTTDGKYLVYHDNDTSRLCDKTLVLEESDSGALRALRLKESGGEAFDETLKIPTLEEYLATVKRYDKTAVIEIKNDMPEKNIAEVIRICKEKYSLDKIIFISFYFENLVRVRKIEPKQAVQFLVGEREEGLTEKLIAHGIDLDIGWWALSAEYIAELHSKGIRINCWTCDDPEKAKELIEWGVDYITSNILE